MSAALDATSYQPREGSVPYRVINYFRRLPDEELSTKDIALKFDTDVTLVHANLKAAVGAEILKRDGTIYSAGPDVGTLEKLDLQARVNAFGDTSAQPVPKPKIKPRKQARQQIDVDTDAIVINSGARPQIGRKHGLADKWGPLLQRLEQVDQWFAVPVEAGPALGAAITKQQKAHPARYRRAKTSATEMIVWRVA